MKLKYYMRGLGIGIIITTLILSIGNPKEKLSDNEIKERARALGMEEMKDDTGLDKAMDKLELTGTPAPTKAPTPVLTKVPTSKPSPKPTKEPTKVPAKASTVKAASADKEAAEKVSFTVIGGMSSRKVARLLEKEGIIKDAQDFNQYIVKIKKAGVIQVGTYSVVKGASYDEIIKIITTKK